MSGNGFHLTPAEIAAWPTPNYTDPPQRTWMPVYAGLLYGLTTAMVGARLWLRAVKRQAGGLGVDDALIFCAWLAMTWFSAVVMIATNRYKLDRHIWDVPPTSFEPAAKFVWIAALAFLFTGCFVKVSVLCFYRRLVRGTYSPRWMGAVLAAIAFTIAYTLAFILALCFNCSPTEAYWKAFDANYTTHFTCVDSRVNNLLAGIMAIVSDLYAVALPLVMTRNFTMPPKQRLALRILFSLALLVVAVSSVRTYYNYKSDYGKDITWNIFNVFVWSQLELALGIMCASAPTVRVLFRDYLGPRFSKLVRPHVPKRSRSDTVPPGPIVTRPKTQSLDALLHPDNSFKHSVHSSIDDISSAESDFDSVSLKSLVSAPPTASIDPLEYESYNLQNMERCRQSLPIRRPAERAVIRNTKHVDGPWSSTEAFLLYNQMQSMNNV